MAISETIRTSLNAVLDYLWHNEQNNYEAANRYCEFRTRRISAAT